MFIDETIIKLTAGGGGRGCVSFRREKFVPYGGPDGGDGGKGGDIFFLGDRGMNTLLDLHTMKHLRSQRGGHGMGKGMTGRGSDDVVLKVPLGTMLFDMENEEQLGDIMEHGQKLVIAKGGRGGMGNARFKSSTRQSPEHAQDGLPGEERAVRLELKVLADVGLVGFPSVGKSTLISTISNAKPKIAEYHFTTLNPQLGMVKWRDFSSYVVADLPGLIEGAHKGRGLGHRFLRHLERTRVLVHLIEVTREGEMLEDRLRDPIDDYHAIRRELEAFNPRFTSLPEIVVLNKVDLPEVRERQAEVEAAIKELNRPFYTVSAVTREGLQALIDAMGVHVKEAKEDHDNPNDMQF
jgi:GTP-binding protein